MEPRTGRTNDAGRDHELDAPRLFGFWGVYQTVRFLRRMVQTTRTAPRPIRA